MTSSHRTWTRRAALWIATAVALVSLPSVPAHAVDPEISPAPVPTFTGVPKPGQNLFINTDGWASGVDFRYEWYIDGKKDPASGFNFTLRDIDAGTVFVAKVFGTKAGFAETMRETAPITIQRLTQSSVPKPEISGTAAVGQTLTAVPGAWDSGVALAYQWLRGSAPIAGATQSTYVVTTADMGQKLALRVTGTKVGYETAAEDSEPTATVPTLPALVAGTVSVSGTSRFGQTLTAAAAGWASGVDLTYQWLRGGTPITGATGASYTTVLADLGAPLSVRATGNKAGYTSASATSAATAAVAAATLAPGSVKIAGAPKVGRTLSARPSGFDAGAAVAYRWLVGTKVVGTQPELKLTKKLAGKKVVLQAVVTKAGYETATVASAPVKVKAVKKPGKKGRGRG